LVHQRYLKCLATTNTPEALTKAIKIVVV